MKETVHPFIELQKHNSGVSLANEVGSKITRHLGSSAAASQVKIPTDGHVNADCVNSQWPAEITFFFLYF